jgi:phosphopantothenoylcysteine decarboxylase/phosphopantothenate--cysteine ligase
MVGILITAGPTREHLDDVRFLSNGSSGRMGFALAVAARAAGHVPYLVLGPVADAPPAGIEVRSVVSAQEMQAEAEGLFAQCEIAIAAAAVADYRPRQRALGKPAKGTGPMTLELVPNPDIVAGLAARKGTRVVVGFALESAAASLADAVARGREKLVRKQLDLVVCNRADAIGQAASEAVMVFADGTQQVLPMQDKLATAAAIVRAAVDLRRRRLQAT